MKIINQSHNTIYVEELDLHLPFQDEDPISVDPEALKKSRELRSIVLSDFIAIHEYDPNERIEASLVYLKNKNKQPVDTGPMVLPDPPELLTADDEIEVKIHGIFYDAGGYAKVNRNLAIKLAEAGFKVQVDAKRSINQLNEDELSKIAALSRTKLSKKHILIDSIIPSFTEVSTGIYKILYTTIESYSIPKQFQECCQQYDEIWLTSEWSAETLRKYVKDKPIYAISTGVDPELYHERGPRFDLRPNVKSFVFLSIFGWNYRKGYDVLLKSYFEEFSADDDVSLVIMSRYQTGQSRFHKNKIKDDIDKIIQEFPNRDLPHVVRYSKVIPEQDMPKLYRAANCFILTSRGEGGCLPPLEASLCGLPIIMTNCSGQQGYLRPDNSYPIEIDRLQEIQPGQMHLHYWDGQLFPALTSPQVLQQVKQAMRSVVTNQSEAQTRNQRLQKMIMEHFTWNHTANAASQRIKEIARKLRG